MTELLDQRAELGEIEVDWEQVPSLRELKQDLEDATPFQQEQVKKIDKWLENLNVEGSAKVKARKGRSSIVPKLIRKQAEWRYSALSEPFLSTDDLFEAMPATWEDVEAARQNELVLNHQFSTDIDKNKFIDHYVRTAVDEGTVLTRVGWEFVEEEYLETVPVVELEADPSLAPLLQEIAQLQQSDPNTFARQVPEELKQALEESLKDGIPYRPVVTGQETVQRTRTVINRPTLEICNYKNIYVDPTCHDDLDKAGFLIYSFESSKALLEKDGRYFNLDQIQVNNNTVVGEPDHTTTEGATNFNFNDEPRKKFVVYEYWGYRDVDGSGELTPFVAAWVGNTLIRLEENPFPDKKIPFVIVSYLPVRRSLFGEPDGALLEDNQRVNGAVTRGMIDILGRSANGQTGMRKDMLDAVNRRKYERGDDYEFNAGVDPRQGVHMHVFPEIPNSAQFMLQANNMEAESLTGVKAFTGGLSGESLGESATGIRGVLDAASKRELGILRRLAAGMVQIGRKIAAMNGEFLSEEEVVRITNEEFVTVRKGELNGKFDLKLSISTAEEDNAKAQELGFMLQTMGNTVDYGIIKKILAKQFRLRKMPDLAKDIEEYEPQPDPLDQQIKQLEIAKLQAEIQKLASEAAENNAEAQLDMAKAENLVADTDQKALDFIEQESGVKQEREKELQGAQAKANIGLKIAEKNLDLRNKIKESELQRYLQNNN